MRVEFRTHLSQYGATFRSRRSEEEGVKTPAKKKKTKRF